MKPLKCRDCSYRLDAEMVWKGARQHRDAKDGMCSGSTELWQRWVDTYGPAENVPAPSTAHLNLNRPCPHSAARVAA